MSSAGEGETFMSQISLQADETYMDERLDKFLSAMLPDQSRSYLQKIIKDGKVLVNGEPKKSSYRLEMTERSDCRSSGTEKVPDPSSRKNIPAGYFI